MTRKPGKHREEEGKWGEKWRPSQQLGQRAESGDNGGSLRADSNKWIGVGEWWWWYWWWLGGGWTLPVPCAGNK